MGAKSWMKYLALMAAFSGIGMRIFSWLTQAQSEGSIGGEDITPEEVTRLAPVISDAINQGLQSVDVPVIAEVRLTYIG